MKPKQFQKCLEYLSLKLADKDIKVLEDNFTDENGFNYNKLLNLVQPAIIDPPKYLVFKEELERLNAKKQLESSSDGSFNEIQSLLKSVKNEVSISIEELLFLLL